MINDPRERKTNFTRLIFDIGDKTLMCSYVRNTHTVCARKLCNRVFRDIPASSMVLGTNYPISITREIQFAD